MQFAITEGVFLHFANRGGCEFPKKINQNGLAHFLPEGIRLISLLGMSEVTGVSGFRDVQCVTVE
jgi:hypothetical protein